MNTNKERSIARGACAAGLGLMAAGGYLSYSETFQASEDMRTARHANVSVSCVAEITEQMELLDRQMTATDNTAHKAANSLLSLDAIQQNCGQITTDQALQVVTETAESGSSSGWNVVTGTLLLQVGAGAAVLGAVHSRQMRR